MRARSVALVGILALVSACVARPLIESGARDPVLPAGTLILVNGLPLAQNHTLDELDPRTITSVQHFIGQAARLHGAGPKQEVILIATSDTLTAARITQR